jgi:hypothetical protein
VWKATSTAERYAALEMLQENTHSQKDWMASHIAAVRVENVASDNF